MTKKSRIGKTLSDLDVKRILEEAGKVERLPDEDNQQIREAILCHLRMKRESELGLWTRLRTSPSRRWISWGAAASAFAALLVVLWPQIQTVASRRALSLDEYLEKTSRRESTDTYLNYPAPTGTPLAATDEVHTPTRTLLNAVPRESLCGPRSLWVAAMRLGLPIEEREFTTGCPHDEKGTTFHDLKQIAESRGLVAELRHLNGEDLSQIQSPAILHVSGNHFLCVDPREKGVAQDGGKLRVYDLPKPALWTSLPDLEEIWEGDALVVSRPAETSVPQGPRIHFDNLLVDFAVAETTASIAYTFRNTGNAPLEVEELKQSCGCTAVRPHERLLEPGGTSQLTVDLALGGTEGPQFQIAQIRTNDPLTPTVPLAVQGVVRNSVQVAPGRVDFGEILPCQSATAEFLVSDRGDQTLKIREVTAIFADACEPANLPSLNVRWERLETSPQIARLKSEVLRRLESRPDLPRFRVIVTATVHEKTPSGTLEGALHVSTNRATRPNLRVPFRLSVVDDYYVLPPRVTFGIVKPGGMASQAIRLQRRTSRPVSLAASTSTFTSEITPPVDVTVIKERPEYIQLELNLTCPSALSLSRTSLAKGNLFLQTDDGFSVDVPWSSIIKSP